jgi:hypothetical protein
VEPLPEGPAAAVPALGQLQQVSPTGLINDLLSAYGQPLLIILVDPRPALN